MIRFEYKTIEVSCKVGFTKVSADVDKINLEFNKMGSQGWELVTCATIGTSGVSQQIYYTFKRPI
ncbi:DUF4177 domain-containing protein [Paenimyroides tangerinum]|mgnify:CR=1 FL=1|uniref:DUF4177 domain-containing protein n=1 Tax=Paenimyroides tangerinum TaxID=2488728 RepID=A0A3P3WFN6_9FLAO|nr:DUF4177 domain-containing protein [Paenimyroides tangerinum]RRJ93197.1 DUF4177 domain-containing protein [Paenimyroides tangerinum]